MLKKVKFTPDYRNIEDAARNKKQKRVALYEHTVTADIMEKMTGRKFRQFAGGDWNAYFKEYNGFFLEAGYDAVSFEAGVVPVLPHGGALSNHGTGWLTDGERLEEYPFDKVLGLYKSQYERIFDALRANMPEGMKAIGGAGFGIFEAAQDLCGFENLCYLEFDEPDAFKKLFVKIGDMFAGIWDWVLRNYGDVFCVARMGDDLGFKSSTMLSEDTIKKELIKEYKKITALAHSYGKPFLFHSCGCIFSVMDELIDIAGIDAKHSNEDQIADFSVWIDKYGKKIGNFGGIDTDHLVRMDNKILEKHVEKIYALGAAKNGGFAIGSGNSIPDYVNPEKYAIMINTVRKLRGEKV